MKPAAPIGSRRAVHVDSEIGSARGVGRMVYSTGHTESAAYVHGPVGAVS